MRFLITGCYGFIGSHVSRSLIAAGHVVVGTDRLEGAISDKRERIASLAGSLDFVEADLAERREVEDLFAAARPEVVIHLAAQFPIRHTPAAVRSYVASNVVSWLNVAEACRSRRVPKMIYASSIMARSRPSSLYGATKGFNEMAGHVYGRSVQMIGLRYAAVYGPSMRSDSGAYRVAKRMLAGEPLDPAGLSTPTLMVEIGEAVEVTARMAIDQVHRGASVYLVAADDEAATMVDVAIALSPHLGVPARLPEGFAPAPRSGRPDLSALRARLGFVPRMTMEEGMKGLAAWLRR